MGRNTPSKIRICIYPFIAALFVVLAYFLVISAIGNTISYKDGHLVFEKNGAILLSTRPGDATVYLDGKIMKNRTPIIRLFTLNVDTVTPGVHRVKIEKDGYESWEGDFDVEASKVAWGVDLILVAQKREARPYNLSGNIVQTLANRDNTRLAVVTENKENGYATIYQINTGNQEQIKIAEKKITIGETWRVAGFSWDSNMILANHTEDKVSTIWVFEAAAGGRSYNVSSQFKSNPEKAVFNPKNHNELFVQRGNEVQNLNFVDKKLSGILQSDVLDIYPSSQGTLAIQKEADGKISIFRLDSSTNSGKTKLVENLPVSTGYIVEYLSGYDSYIVLPVQTGKLLRYSRSDGKQTPKELTAGADYFLVSPNGNFVTYRVGKDYFDYDVDREKTYLTLFGRELSSISWFGDEVNLIYGENGKMKLITRTGNYDKFLFDIDNNFPVLVSQNNDNIYFAVTNANAKTDLAVYNLNY